MKTLKNILKALAAVLLPVVAMASGDKVGGGGDVVILPNDKVVIADPFLDHSGHQPNNMPPLRAINPRLMQIAALYAEAAKSHLNNLSPKRGSDIVDEISKLTTRGSDLRFYAVENEKHLNQFCAPGGKKSYKLPPNYVVSQVACTAGNETFLVENLFVRLSMREQVLLLIHERLTTLRDQYGGKNYSAIARLTTGLNKYLDIYQEQAQGRFRTLSEAEVSALTDFYIAAEEIQYRNSDPTLDSFQWRAHSKGGGRVHLMAKVHPTATIGIVDRITKNISVGANSRVSGLTSQAENTPIEIGENTTIYNIDVKSLSPVKIGNRARLSNVFFHVYSLSVGSDVLIEDSSFVQNFRHRYGLSILDMKLTISDGVKVQKSQIEAPVEMKFADFLLGREVQIQNSKVYLVLQSDSRIGERTKISDSSLTLQKSDYLAEDQVIAGANVNKESVNYFPETAQLKSLAFEIFFKDFLLIADNRQGADQRAQQTVTGQGVSVGYKYKNVLRRFRRANTYAYDITANIRLNPTQKSKDESLSVIEEGKVLKAGFYKYAEFNVLTGEDNNLAPIELKLTSMGLNYVHEKDWNEWKFKLEFPRLK